MATQTVAVPIIPSTLREALLAGYQVALEKSTMRKGKRAGTLLLTNGSRPKLTVTYKADRAGYQFNQPQAV